jgi:hypothetical protein
VCVLGGEGGVPACCLPARGVYCVGRPNTNFAHAPERTNPSHYPSITKTKTMHPINRPSVAAALAAGAGGSMGAWS